MLEAENDDKEPGIVIQEMQSGYKDGPKIVKTRAFVEISKKKAQNNDQKEQKNKLNAFVEKQITPI